MKFFTIVAFLAGPISVNALECAPHPDPLMADAVCSKVDPCAADNPCFAIAEMPCCEKEEIVFCCGSIDGISTLDTEDDQGEGVTTTAVNPNINVNPNVDAGGDGVAIDPVNPNAPDVTLDDEAPTPASTDSAAPKESAITAAIGVALVGAALL